jgi:site-specific DNA recombinase
MNVALYLRVSTEEQRERQSIETQREFGDRYCQLHQLPVSDTYVDDGISGTVALENRPAGKRLLQDARRGRFDQILVFRLDRLGRETRLILNVVAELEKIGIRVKSMTEEFDTATSTGRLMLTMLSGFAAHERDAIRERSIAGTNRVAEAGAWLGGIVPYGYRKVGEKSTAKLVVSDETMLGFVFSEADVIRLIYRMAATERKSCFAIADLLNKLRVPCAYTRDSRELLRGKRKQKTSGLWRPARIRNLLVSKTYMGEHEYGKRTTNKNRKIIVRRVAPIVDGDVWRQAQAVLKSNQLYSDRNVKMQYLLRGLIKCGLCGLTYVGIMTNRSETKPGILQYRCNGKQGYRGIYGAQGLRCPAKDVNGYDLEQLIWADLEGFLRDPGKVMEQLHAKLVAEQPIGGGAQQIEQFERSLAEKVTERPRILSLFRRGRISEAELEQQLNEIDEEEISLREAIQALAETSRRESENSAALASAEALLGELRQRLDNEVAFDVKRQLVEVLVGHVKVDTIQNGAHKEASATVTYRFPMSTVTCTDTDSSR